MFTSPLSFAEKSIRKFSSWPSQKRPLRYFSTSLVVCGLSQLAWPNELSADELSYPIVDTGVEIFTNDKEVIDEPTEGQAFYGQDAHFASFYPSYEDNEDGTVADLVTGLIWQKNMGEKMTYKEALEAAEECQLGGYDDWRIPSIKELYSLIDFRGEMRRDGGGELFIDTGFFDQPLGDEDAGERPIDAQTWSSTFYVGKTMRASRAIFGVNFIDGRIKAYPLKKPRSHDENKMYFRLVRGNEDYGVNKFVDNEDGTVTDEATGLMWQIEDSGEGMDWQMALDYANNLELAGHSDWRLPNAKELQSIVDYNRSPQTTRSAAIDPLFFVSEIKGPDRRKNFPYFWSSTTHQDGRNPYDSAVYFAFGDALGKMHDRVIDVHGAGAQRSDPKSGDESDYPKFHGPQGDLRAVYNYVRCVRDVE